MFFLCRFLLLSGLLWLCLLQQLVDLALTYQFDCLLYGHKFALDPQLVVGHFLALLAHDLFLVAAALLFLPELEYFKVPLFIENLASRWGIRKTLFGRNSSDLLDPVDLFNLERWVTKVLFSLFSFRIFCIFHKLRSHWATFLTAVKSLLLLSFSTAIKLI